MTEKTCNKIYRMQKNVPYGMNTFAPELVHLLKNAHRSSYSDLEQSARYANMAGAVGEWIAYLQDLLQDMTDLHNELLDISDQYGTDIMEVCGEDVYIDAHNHDCDYDNYKVSRKHGVVGYWDVNL